jgi:hypothetical protein
MIPATVRPPLVAVWLLHLFIPYGQSESITGDLLEEFSDLAPKSGVAYARRWYWLQSVKTTAHLIGTGFRVALWHIAGAMFVGYLFGWCCYFLVERIVDAMLHAYHVYAHVDAHAFWLIYAILLECLIGPMLVGIVVGLVARGREMIATTTMGLLNVVGGGVSLIRNFRFFHEPNTAAFLQPLLVAIFVTPVLIVVGGGIVRKIRLAGARRPSGV